ncbi:MAG: N-acetylglucosamine-6-phosphate deacetylase [Oscillatoriales cyanobacterium C42_A2020_001]|nr:N-acetylglucosamine-6-phosphate deacetylase [Leptolyngbyaceae cyanobacterium C42_A2020_001]
MDNSLTVTNARIPGYSGLQTVVVQQGAIAAIYPQSCTPAIAATPILDIQGDWVSLGGVDLQINGALGLAFPDLSSDTSDKLGAISEFLWQQGVDAYLPTLVTSSLENIQRSLAVISQWQAEVRSQESGVRSQKRREIGEIGEIRKLGSPTPLTPVSIHPFTLLPSSSPSPSLPSPSPSSAQILGVHLEGPFLNPEKRGAHPKEYLQPLTLENVKRVLGEYAHVVKVMTLAPELDEPGEVIPYLRSLGITVSLGHSLATAEQAQRAFAQGASMVTHAFNAMPPLHHREPGLLGAAITHPTVHCGLIADGQHVSPIMADILLRASEYDQGIFLVSDALAPLGLPDGVYPWDTRQIEVKQGTARLPDGTLSGTTLGLWVGAQNLVKWGICSVEQAIALATTAPRRAINLPTDYIGQPAHLLRWHQSKTGELEWERLLA